MLFPTRSRQVLLALLLAGSSLALPLLSALPAPARAEEVSTSRSDAYATIAKATATVTSLRSDANFPQYWQPHLLASKGVLIVPSFYKAGFFVGGAYGNGVLLVRDASGQFSPPAFYRMGAGSLGFQFGAEERSIMFMIKTDKGLQAILEDKFKVGAGVSLAVASWGGGLEASTTSAAGADIIAFSHASGVFGGGAIEGAGIDPRIDWNRAVYGANANSKTILFDRRYQLPQATPLIQALDEASHANTILQLHPAAPAAGQNTAPAAPVVVPRTEAPAPQAAPRAAIQSESLAAPAAPAPSVAPVPAPASAPAPSTTATPAASHPAATGTPVKLIPSSGKNLQ